MRLWGWDISFSRVKAPVSATTIPSGWDSNFGSAWWGGGWCLQEPFTGAWQRNLDKRPDSILAYYAVYACVKLISSDISKLELRLTEEVDGISEEVELPSGAAFIPVLRKPNHYQNRIKFIEQWIISKLTRGNTYVLKGRDARGVVNELYVLDPCRVRPLVANDGSVWYQCGADNLSGVPTEGVTIPASEIIHDVMVPLYHPLCGVSPLVACGMAALQGMNIQNNSSMFFQNGSKPGGVLSAPGLINDTTAKRLKDHWEQNYSGANAGKIAVLGDGLKFEAMSFTAEDSQLIEQLKWTGETVCACYNVPPYMIGIGTPPAYNNIEALNQQYYSQCLQVLMENIELCMDEGLGLPDVAGHTYETEFDLEDLLRMDTFTKVEAASKAVGAGIMAPNEARAKFDLPPVEGGETPYLQQQNYALSALKRRDEQPPPPATTPAAPAGGPPAPAAESAPAESSNASPKNFIFAASAQVIRRVPYAGRCPA